MFFITGRNEKLEEVSLIGRNSCLEHTLDAFYFAAIRDCVILIL